MKRIIIYILSVIYISIAFTNFSLALEIFINSPELSDLKKVKNIKNKKGKRNKDGMTYVGQKGLILWNGYGILRFKNGDIFAGKFVKGDMRDGAWVINGDVAYETYEYDSDGNFKTNSSGDPIINKTVFRPAKEFEIDYIKENVFLKNKISYEKYLELTGKDKLIAKKEKSKPKEEKKNEEEFTEVKSTGFNIFSGDLEDKTPYYIEAYYKDDCVQHGLVRYLFKDKKRSKQDTFGKFENCKIFDPNSKFANVFYNEEGEVIEINLHKKDVSHIYGVRLMIGIEINNLPNNKGVQIAGFQKDMPAKETALKEKDLLLKVNGISVKNTQNFIQLIKESKPNQKIKIDYVPNNKINENYEFNNSDINTLEITPKMVSSKIELRIAYLKKQKEYVEYLVDHETGRHTDIHDMIKYEKGTDEWLQRQKILKKEFRLLEDYYTSIKKSRSDKIPLFDFSQLYVVSNKSTTNKIVKKTKEEFKPDDLEDKDPPIIKIAKNFTFNSSSYSITGEVKDNKSDIIYIEVDGIISDTKDGKFIIDRFSPVSERIEIVAIDKWGNRSKPSIIDIKINKEKKTLAKKLERLDPRLNKIDPKENRVALIIGIENYLKTPKASFANLDAEFFYEYAKNTFGVKEENIKLLVNEEANLIDTLTTLNKWLPSKINKNTTELFVYYAGHGLASTDGKELYFLPQDGDSDLLVRTGISRTELYESIKKLSPKNITIFLDTCYSGVSRDDKTLLASARPVRIIANDKDTPDNFTVFSASQLDQISSGLKQAKHGIFSYYLMKGLEGKADANKDNKITNGELLAYIDLNVSQKAAELGREQNPSLAGDPDKVLVSYR